ncbi:hypothetical protein FIV00_16910 [Labrenzia sp. THAF82]|nr:hypothetical protein FIV00_16910 [Labrenzia sp. THAF82]
MEEPNHLLVIRLSPNPFFEVFSSPQAIWPLLFSGQWLPDHFLHEWNQFFRKSRIVHSECDVS